MSIHIAKNEIENMKYQIELIEKLIERIVNNETILEIDGNEFSTPLMASKHLNWCYENNIFISHVKLHELFDDSIQKTVTSEKREFIKSLIHRLPSDYYQFKSKEDALAFKLRWHGDDKDGI